MTHPVFQRDFDLERAEEEARRVHDARARHTPEELEEAVARAYRAGHAAGKEVGRTEGRDETRQTLLARHAEAISAIQPQVDALLAGTAEHRAALEAQVLDFTVSVCEKVFPELIDHRARDRALQQIERTIRYALGSPVLRITLAPAARDALGPQIEAIVAETLIGTLDLSADPDLAEGDARMTWDNGFMEYSFAEICDRILDAVRDRQESFETTRAARRQEHA
ncbi:hypothetical protein EKE94_16155 [Mesobaculum littorinae]|uniref:Flagellar assembly protein FliH/Type III secretion system HrpE domain-containing protein n=1 Tax=Mesobaculum littorinae TaxID=2486419 RepID=A0A438ADY4_9RHOB|nr:hypothetical protein [Mesobaculum littorinae]RVV96877.1 hypothetical protein EKE94_16155 [Mesobaculum littorinae]